MTTRTCIYITLWYKIYLFFIVNFIYMLYMSFLEDLIIICSPNFSIGCERLPSQTHEKVRIARDVPSGQPARLAYPFAELPWSPGGRSRLVAGARSPGRHSGWTECVAFTTSRDLRSDLCTVGIPSHVHRVRLWGSGDVGEKFQGDFAVQVKIFGDYFDYFLAC